MILMGRLGKMTKDFRWLATLLFVFSIPVSQYISTRLLILLLVLLLWRSKITRVFFRSWDIVLYLIVLGVGMLYTEDTELGLRELETSLSLLVVPLVFGAIPEFDEEKINEVILSFTAGLFFTSQGILFYAIKTFSATGSTDAFLFNELTEVVDFQPTYFAYFLVFSITGLLYMLNYGKSPIKPFILSLIILFLFAVLMLTGGKTTFISILLVFSFFILKYLLERNTIGQRVTLVLVALMMLVMFATSTRSGSTTRLDDSWDRYDLWVSAVAANTNPLLGVGTGDYRTIMNDHLVRNNKPHFAAESLNAHNQFIQRYLSNGLLGFLACVILLGRPLYLSFRQDQTMAILIFFPFVLYGMTEVFLGRYQGVVFFALMHQVVVSAMLTRSQSGIALKKNNGLVISQLRNR